MSANQTPERQPPVQLPPVPRLAIDFGPLIVFFAVYNLAHLGLLGVDRHRAIYLATEATMAASIVAVIISLALTRRISAALMITSGMMLLFGGLTIALDNPHFVKIKPTIVYAMYATALLIGVLIDRPLLKIILGPGFPSMAHSGWIKISRNFGMFFIFMGVLNEFMWRSFNEDTWVFYDVWGVLILTAAFMGSQYPIISRYMDDAESKPVTPAPPG